VSFAGRQSLLSTPGLFGIDLSLENNAVFAVEIDGEAISAVHEERAFGKVLR